MVSSVLPATGVMRGVAVIHARFAVKLRMAVRLVSIADARVLEYSEMMCPRAARTLLRAAPPVSLGYASAARMPTITKTINASMRVKPARGDRRRLFVVTAEPRYGK